MRALYARSSWLVLGAVLFSACADAGTGPGTQYPPVRIVTFGDSNTDYAYGANGTVVARSYVSNRLDGRLDAAAPHHPAQLAGLIETRWLALGRSTITAVNHAISGTSSGGGAGGGQDRHSPTTAPNARTAVNGTTRFEAEVLGKAYPWNGGEYSVVEYPAGPLVRSNAFVPAANDFAYVSIGTNDANAGITTGQTITNLTWMVDRWIADGHAPNRFMITTLAPRTGADGATFPQINTAIRDLAAARGIKLIDLAAFTSSDNGATWKAADLHVGDGLHYATVVREWLADQVVAHMATVVSPQ